MQHLATLHPTPPYRFDLLLNLLARYAHPTLDIAHQGAYWRAIHRDGQIALLKVVAGGTTDAPTLDVYQAGGGLDTDLALERLRRILDVNADHRPFYDFARGDPALWRVIKPLEGLPNVRAASLFEGLVQTIIEQQISWTGAQRAQRWLVKWANNRIWRAGVDYYAFPTPEQIAVATVADLTPLKITFKRMALLIDVARRVVSGQLDLEGLGQVSPESAYRTLLAVKGIGHWTAVVALDRAFGHHFGVAHTDVVLQIAVNRYFFGGEGRAPADLTADTFARYGHFAGVAAHYVLSRYVLDSYPALGTVTIA